MFLLKVIRFLIFSLQYSNNTKKIIGKCHKQQAAQRKRFRCRILALDKWNRCYDKDAAL